MSRRTPRTPGADKYRRIYEMGPEKMEALDAMIAKQMSLTDITREVQEKWGFCQDIKENTLYQMLKRYKMEYFGTRLKRDISEMLIEAVPEVGKVALTNGRVHFISRRVKNNLDAYAQLEDMIEVQIKRLNKILERESKLPTLMDMVRREMELLLKLTEKLAALQFDLGIIQRIPRKVDVELTDKTLVEDEDFRGKVEAARRSQDVVSKVKRFLLEFPHEERSVVDGECILAEVLPSEGDSADGVGV